MTATARNKLATQTILKAIDVSDGKVAAIAALEAMSERLTWDAALRQTVRQKYDELQALSAPKQKADLGPMPTPIQTPGLTKTTPLHVVDPYDLRDTYGSHQLRNVLQRVGRQDLRDGVKLVQKRTSGTKLPSLNDMNAMIDYIMQHVAGPEY